MRTGWPFLLYTEELPPDEARPARWYTASPWPAALIALLAVAAAIVKGRHSPVGFAGGHRQED